MKNKNSAFYTLVNLLLFIAGVSALAAGVVSTWKLQAVTSTAFFSASLVLLFASTIDRFESLKGFGMEAKQRELTRTLAEVNDVLKEVQRLNFFTSKSLAALYAKTGRSAGPPSAAEIYDVISEFRTSMKHAQASDSMIKEALAPCVQAMLFDLAYVAIQPVLSALEVRAAHLQGRASLLPKDGAESERQALQMASMAVRGARTQIMDCRDFSEAGFPGKLITMLRSQPACETLESEAAAQLLASFSADIQSLQRRGKIDDTAAWFKVVDR